MPGNEDQTLVNDIGSFGWLFTTVIFLMLVFVMAIVNSIFFIRIYNQSKDRDSGTGINGLSVTGSLVIGVISIIIGVIAFGWSLYLISKIYKNKDAIKQWYMLKKQKFADWKQKQVEKAQTLQNAFNFFKRSGDSDEAAVMKAQKMCLEMGYIPGPSMNMPTSEFSSINYASSKFPTVPTSEINNPFY
jgi:hypothetical protein